MKRSPIRNLAVNHTSFRGVYSDGIDVSSGAYASMCENSYSYRIRELTQRPGTLQSVFFDSVVGYHSDYSGTVIATRNGDIYFEHDLDFYVRREQTVYSYDFDYPVALDKNPNYGCVRCKDLWGYYPDLNHYQRKDMADAILWPCTKTMPSSCWRLVFVINEPEITCSDLWALKPELDMYRNYHGKPPDCWVLPAVVAGPTCRDVAMAYPKYAKYVKLNGVFPDCWDYDKYHRDNTVTVFAFADVEWRKFVVGNAPIPMSDCLGGPNRTSPPIGQPIRVTLYAGSRLVGTYVTEVSGDIYILGGGSIERREETINAKEATFRFARFSYVKSIPSQVAVANYLKSFYSSKSNFIRCYLRAGGNMAGYGWITARTNVADVFCWNIKENWAVYSPPVSGPHTACEITIGAVKNVEESAMRLIRSRGYFSDSESNFDGYTGFFSDEYVAGVDIRPYYTDTWRPPREWEVVLIDKRKYVPVANSIEEIVRTANANPLRGIPGLYRGFLNNIGGDGIGGSASTGYVYCGWGYAPGYWPNHADSYGITMYAY